jgi:hypothetical protein
LSLGSDGAVIRTLSWVRSTSILLRRSGPQARGTQPYCG